MQFLKNRVSILCLLLVLPSTLWASYQAGVDYEIINPPIQTTSDKGHIEVIEAYSYSCPHCFKLST